MNRNKKLLILPIILIISMVLIGCSSNSVDSVEEDINDGGGGSSSKKEYNLEVTKYVPPRLDISSFKDVEITPDKDKYEEGEEVKLRAYHHVGDTDTDDDIENFDKWVIYINNGDEKDKIIKETRNPLIIEIKDDTKIRADYALDRPDVFRTSGHEHVLYEGIFKNPDYTSDDKLLMEDELTKQTEAIDKVKEKIITGEDDLTKIKEIYTFLKGIEDFGSSDKEYNYYFSPSASEILSSETLNSCGHYATLFMTLARAEGIHSVYFHGAYKGMVSTITAEKGEDFRTHAYIEAKINGEWKLIDPTRGILYSNYDRNNWYLPNGNIGYQKGLSIIDVGIRDLPDLDNDGLVDYYQPGSIFKKIIVAFMNRNYEADQYVNPNYPESDLYLGREEKVNKWDKFNSLDIKNYDHPNIDFMSGVQRLVDVEEKDINFQDIDY